MCCAPAAAACSTRTITLKSLRHDDYNCALCAQGYEASVDDRVEVAFTVSPRVRRIAAHDPNTLPIWEYNRQMFWSSGDRPERGIVHAADRRGFARGARTAGGREGGAVAAIAQQFVIVFEPVTHSAHFLDIQGEPTRERQQFSIVFNKLHAPTGTTVMRPGPLRLSLENQTDQRVLPSVWVANDTLHELLGKRKPILTAKRMLSNQTFRDVFKADNLNVDQRLKITSLTFLFTDLKGSTALYERVGDLAAPCFACALGGRDGRTLLVCAAPDFLEHNRRETRDAVLLTTTVDVPHAGLP